MIDKDIKRYIESQGTQQLCENCANWKIKSRVVMTLGWSFVGECNIKRHGGESLMMRDFYGCDSWKPLLEDEDLEFYAPET